MTATIGNEIRQARLTRGWPQQRLADEANMTVAQVNAIETGRSAEGQDDIISALGLELVQPMLLEPLTARFLGTIRPVVQRIKPDLLPVALAAVLDVAGRAAAGELPPTASTVVVQAGGDISQTNLGA